MPKDPESFGSYLDYASKKHEKTADKNRDHFEQIERAKKNKERHEKSLRAVEKALEKERRDRWLLGGRRTRRRRSMGMTRRRSRR